MKSHYWDPLGVICRHLLPFLYTNGGLDVEGSEQFRRVTKMKVREGLMRASRYEETFGVKVEGQCIGEGGLRGAT